jgi:hypothetical protein
MYIHVGTAWWLNPVKGHNPGLKGFRCVQLHNVWWQQIPIPHCSWGKGHLSDVNTTGFYLKCPVVCISRASTRWYSAADPGFQVRGGGALKKIAPNGGRCENFGGISCEKSRFYAKKSYFFQF